VAAALGPVQTPRAILAADGTTAQPLKIYLPRVNWVQSHKQRVLVGEIDLVGAQKLQAIIPKPGQVYLHLRAGRRPLGKPLPMRLAPPGQRLLRRWRVSNWVLARFLLPHPERLSVNQIVRIAPRYFQHTPASLMVFFQGTS
jgi:hypothetical protein